MRPTGKPLAGLGILALLLTACAPDGDDPSTWSEGRQLNWIEDDPYYRERGATEDVEGMWEDSKLFCDAIRENFGDDYGNFIEQGEEAVGDAAIMADLGNQSPIESYMVFEQYVGVNLHCPEYAEDFYEWTDAEPQGT